MKKLMIRFVMMLSLLAVNATFCWDLWVHNNAATNENARVDLKWASGCKTDTFRLRPGESKLINAGICNLERAEVDWPYGGPSLLVSKELTGGNPVNGLRIIRNPDGKLQVITNDQYLAGLSHQERVDLYQQSVVQQPEDEVDWRKPWGTR